MDAMGLGKVDSLVAVLSGLASTERIPMEMTTNEYWEKATYLMGTVRDIKTYTDGSLRMKGYTYCVDGVL